MKKYFFIFVLFCFGLSNLFAIGFEGLEQAENALSSPSEPENRANSSQSAAFPFEAADLNFQPDENSFRSADHNAYRNWAANIRLSHGLTIQDFLRFSNSAEIQRLLNILSETCLASAGNDEEEIFYDFFRNMDYATRKKQEENINIQHLSLLQFDDLRKGFRSKQDSKTDLLLIKSFLQKLYSGSPSVTDNSAPMLQRIKARLHSLISKALPVCNKEQDDNDGFYNRNSRPEVALDFVRTEILEPWKRLGEALNVQEINSSFPWNDMVGSTFFNSRNYRLSRFRKGFEPGAALIVYLQFLKPILESAQHIINFTSSTELLANLQKIRQSGINVGHSRRHDCH
jgi:hypothetical protein